MPTESGLPENIVAALKRGNKIEAIKLLREQTGGGLKEAKDAIEASGIGPEPVPPGQVPAGSAYRWLILVGLLLFVAYYFSQGRL